MTKNTCSISRKAKVGLTAQGAASTVYLFPEGLFVRAYNESAYIITELLGRPLKVTTLNTKQFNYKPLAYCGVRLDRIKKHFKDAKLNNYGYYTWHGKFDLSNYQNWINNGVKDLTEHDIEKGTGNAVFEDFDENTNWESPFDEEGCEIIFTEEQIEFLTNWNAETATPEQIEKFMLSLKATVQEALENACYELDEEE